MSREEGPGKMKGPPGLVRSGLACLFLVLLLSLGASQAGAQSVGGLRGMVTDSDFQAPIIGAQVTILEAGLSGVTDDGGRFVVPGLAPGKYTVAVAREGYGRKLVYDVPVAAGAIREVQVEMVSDVVELDEFTISSEDLVGDDAAQLLDVRQNMTAFVDTVGADFISKVGGGDVGDVLKRIVGTSVADSRYVVVRGLSDRYNTVVLNGLRVPSSDPDKRAVNVDIFPSSIVKELANSKTFSPEISGESTGGSINIITKSNPEKPFVNASLGLAYNTQATGNDRFVTYHGGGTDVLGKQNARRIPDFLRNSTMATLGEGSSDPAVIANYRKAESLVSRTTGVDTGAPPLDMNLNFSLGGQYQFFGRPLGLLAAFTYSKKYEFDPDVQRASSTVSQVNVGNQVFRTLERKSRFETQESLQSLLSGLLVSAGWQPSDTDTIKLTFFANVAADDRAIFGKGLVNLTNTDDPNRDIDIESAQSVAVREAIQYTERRLRTMQIAGDHVFPDFADAEIRWAAAYSESSQDEPDLRFNNYVANRGNGVYEPLSSFSGKPLERIWRHLDDTNYNILLEGKVPLFKNSDGEDSTFVKAGMNFDYSTREYRADNFGYGNFPTIPVPEVLGAANRDGLTLGDQISQVSLLARVNSEEIYQATQSIWAGYGAVNFDLTSQININVGARVEAANIRVFRDLTNVTQADGDVDASTALLIDLNTGQLLPPDQIGKATIDEVDVLPALGVTWDLPTDQNIKLKFAASQTVARPSFKELGPVFTRDPGTSSRFVGNVGLQTSDITNLDLRAEWFPAPGDVFAISLFTKHIRNPIELNSTASFDYYINEESATLYGFEFEALKRLDFLGAPFDKFSIGLNGARLYSKVELSEQSINRRRPALSDTRRLQGQPDYLLNFNLSYDNKELGFFAGLFMNITGETLYSAGGQVGDETGVDVFQQPYTSLDFTMSKKLNEHCKITFRAENLLNSATERISEGGVEYSKRSGTKYSVSIGGTW